MHGSTYKHMYWHITRHWGNIIYLAYLYSLYFISSNISLHCAFKLTCGSQAKNGDELFSSGSLEAAGPDQEHCRSAPRRQWGYRLWNLSSFEPPWLMLLREKVKGFAGISLYASCVSTPCKNNISKVSLRLRGQKWPTLKMPLCSSQPVIQISIWKVVGSKTQSVNPVYLMISSRNIWWRKGEGTWPL